ncbi:AMP-binding protein [Roseomonas populi]|uniref:AMP-binding protein n=1 Tax=Roseomonas populi TaxID=3121582 RepID=A0ABT1WZ89_9PROT|nr:AMP-binding protein [Roseomonas pecuniae]MCR0981173.1 AMP-binding protein [Roseomonas pecuniae]
MTGLALEGLCPLTVAEALRRAVTIAPEVEAVVAPSGRITFAALEEEVAAIRAALLAEGVGRGEHVGLLMGNGPRWVSIFLALGSIGAVTVPVNTRFQAEEMAYALRQSRVRRLFVVDRFLKIDFVAMLRGIIPGLDGALPDASLPDLQQVVVVGTDVPAGARSWEDFFSAGRGNEAPPRCVPEDVLLMQYTSGTTSFPKGVMLTHRSMCANAFFSGGRMGLRVADRFHSARPFFHVAGSTLSILSCIQHVTTLVTMDRFEPAEALRIMEEERCTHFSGNDTMALMLLNHPDRARRSLALRGAWAAASPSIVRRIIEEMGARDCVVGYGMSEASPNISQSCWWEPEEVRISGHMRPQPGVEVRIRDLDSGEDLPPGGTGEILVRGWNVMQGYFDKPKETAETLTSEGWLLTGDLGRLDEAGRLEFAGRAKDLVRVGGENVSPAEVEDILNRHPAIRQAVVVGVPDSRLMEVPCAFVILNEGQSCEPEALIAWSKENMAGFKVPRYVRVVEDFESIGMTASSKIQKKQLAKHAIEVLGIKVPV